MRCLRSVAAQKYPRNGYEIVVVDDGSIDETEAVVTRFCEEEPLLRIRYGKITNGGPARARNFGIERCDGELVAFLDDDSYAEEGWLKALVDCFETNDVDAAEGVVLSNGDSILPFCHHTENRGGGQFLTANMAFRRDLIKQAGMFDTTFRHAHAEDKELACRVMKIGGRIMFCDDAIVYHPPREMSFQEAVRGWQRYGDFLKLYSLHPDMFKLMTGRRLPFFLLDTVFLVPLVDLKEWIGRVKTLRLMLKLLFFSYSKSLVTGTQVLMNLGNLWTGHRKSSVTSS